MLDNEKGLDEKNGKPCLCDEYNKDNEPDLINENLINEIEEIEETQKEDGANGLCASNIDLDNSSETELSFTSIEKNSEKTHTVSDALDDIKTDISALSATVQGICESSAKTAKEIYELHKLYHNEYAKRLSSMQDELEKYREIDKGRVYDGILIEIAKLYSENAAAVKDITDEKIQKRFRNMFLDLLQLLENNGVIKQESKQGEKRNTRHCQVVERIPTDDPQLHDTVIKSINIGFYIENRTLIKEMVHVYVSKKADSQSDNN